MGKGNQSQTLREVVTPMLYRTDIRKQRKLPRATPLRPPAEGEPCECEREAAEIVVMAEGTSRMIELPMEVANVDEAGWETGDEGNEIACGSLPKLQLQKAHIHYEDSQHNEKRYLKHTECYLRESGQSLYERQRIKELKRGHNRVELPAWSVAQESGGARSAWVGPE